MGESYPPAPAPRYVVRSMRRLVPGWVYVVVVDDRLRVRAGVLRFCDTAEPMLTEALARLFDPR